MLQARRFAQTVRLGDPATVAQARPMRGTSAASRGRMKKQLMMLLLTGGCVAEADLGTEAAGPKAGTGVPSGELEAVVYTGGCTGTFTTDSAVLTAAHCVCNDADPPVCGDRKTVTFKQVFGTVDDPATSIDERVTRSDL